MKGRVNSVRIDIVAIGSEGDIRPSVALGRGLRRAGHRVRVVTLDGFEDLVRRHGLDHLSIGRSPRALAGTAEGREWVERRATLGGFLRGFVRVARSVIETGIANYWPECRDVEALIVTAMGLPVGMHIAERLRVPMIRVSFAPSRHDWAGKSDLVTAVRGQAGRVVWAACRFAIWSQLRSATNVARREVLSLPPLPRSEPLSVLDRRGVPLLDAYSPSVVPKPPGWDNWLHVTGYWFLDETSAWVPPSELVDFLDGGTPPVFVGFGSTPFPNARAATAIVVDALRRVGQRGVVVAGGSGAGTGRLAEHVLSVDAVPHEWLFRRVGLAVHHGGAGVTAAALRAGLPSVVVPVFGDQPFWARRLFELGAAARAVPAKQLSVDRLASAIRVATTNEEMRRRAGVLSEQIQKEDGVARAVAVVHDYLALGDHARRAS